MKTWLVIVMAAAVVIIFGAMLVYEENQIKSLQKNPFQGLNPQEYSFDCIAWYGSCGKLLFDNATGMYIPKGYLDPTCEDTCSTRAFHKLTQLPTIYLPLVTTTTQPIPTVTLPQTTTTPIETGGI